MFVISPESETRAKNKQHISISLPLKMLGGFSVQITTLYVCNSSQIHFSLNPGSSGIIQHCCFSQGHFYDPPLSVEQFADSKETCCST